MKSNIERQTVDVSKHPDMIVIILGMRQNTLRGLKTVLRVRGEIARAAAEKPDGLLLHEDLFYSFVPLHAGMRQYWRDFDALERWSRSLPHSHWWKDFLSDTSGTGFWHETYFMRGGMEAVYINMEAPVGMMNFAPLQPARGPMFTARTRARLNGPEQAPIPVTEEQLYGANGRR